MTMTPISVSYSYSSSSYRCLYPDSPLDSPHEPLFDSEIPIIPPPPPPLEESSLHRLNTPHDQCTLGDPSSSDTTDSKACSTSTDPQSSTLSDEPVTVTRKRSREDSSLGHIEERDIIARLLAIWYMSRGYAPGSIWYKEGQPQVRVMSSSPFTLQIPIKMDFMAYMSAKLGENHAIHCCDSPELQSKRYLWWEKSPVLNPVINSIDPNNYIDPNETHCVYRLITLPETLIRNPLYLNLSFNCALTTVIFFIRSMLHFSLHEEEIGKIKLVGCKFLPLKLSYPYATVENEAVMKTISYLMNAQKNTIYAPPTLPPTELYRTPKLPLSRDPHSFIDCHSNQLPADKPLLGLRKVKARLQALTMLLTRQLPKTELRYIDQNQLTALNSLAEQGQLIKATRILNSITITTPLLFDVICHLQAETINPIQRTWSNTEIRRKGHLRWWTDHFPYKPVSHDVVLNCSILQGYVRRKFTLPTKLASNQTFMSYNLRSMLAGLLKVSQIALIKECEHKKIPARLQTQITWDGLLDASIEELFEKIDIGEFLPLPD